MEISRLRIADYIPREIPSVSRWTPRRSYELGRRTSYPFDLKQVRRAQAKPSGFLSKIIEWFTYDEEPFQLPSIEDFQGIYQDKTPQQWTYSLPLPDPFQEPLQFSELVWIRPEDTFHEIPEKERLLKSLKMLFILKGRLRRSKKGLFYIEFPKNLERVLLPNVVQWGAEFPPHFELLEGTGPHIPVILPHEDLDGFTQFDEIDEEFYFAIKDLHCRETVTREGIQKIWYVSFESYDLEAIRQKYGLISFPAGQDFHCVFGINQGPSIPMQEFYHINPICEPA